MQRVVRFLTAGSVLVSLVGAASAQEAGLTGALDQQQQDLQRQQSDFQRQIDSQQRTLQRQEDQALQQGLRSSLGRTAPTPGSPGSPAPPRMMRR